MSGKSGSGTTPNRGWFSKDRSGNPGGRPTASHAPQSSAFDIVAEKALTAAYHGIAREITLTRSVVTVGGDRTVQRRTGAFLYSFCLDEAVPGDYLIHRCIGVNEAKRNNSLHSAAKCVIFLQSSSKKIEAD